MNDPDFRVLLFTGRVIAVSERAKEYMRIMTWTIMRPEGNTDMIPSSLEVCLTEILHDGYIVVDGHGKPINDKRMMRLYPLGR